MYRVTDIAPIELVPRTKEDILVEHQMAMHNIQRLHVTNLSRIVVDHYEYVVQERKRLQWMLADLSPEHILLTKPWMWIYLRGVHPHSHWGPPPCLVTDFIALDLHILRHRNKQWYQRKQIPHMKRGFSEFNLRFPIVRRGPKPVLITQVLPEPYTPKQEDALQTFNLRRDDLYRYYHDHIREAKVGLEEALQDAQADLRNAMARLAKDA